jgi:dimethylhistidine N-methyltransferase
VISALHKAVRFHDAGPDSSQFLDEALAGLTRSRKTLPCKYFYDDRGSQLFDRICNLPEYYPTRTEIAILQTHAQQMADCVGPKAAVVEYGSGSCIKTRLLLDRLADPAAYAPVDISREHLLRSAAGLAQDYPSIPILPVCADYMQPITLPEQCFGAERVAIYFPGSTIGNFDAHQARTLLRSMARLAGPKGALLIGVDLKKPRSILEPAYNDSQDVTAEFNLNILARLNSELGANFDLNSFAHIAPYNRNRGCIEMHLVSLREQSVRLGDARLHFFSGETIRTERSYKYTLSGFSRLAESAGFAVRRVWTDPAALFSVQYVEVLS